MATAFAGAVNRSTEATRCWWWRCSATSPDDIIPCSGCLCSLRTLLFPHTFFSDLLPIRNFRPLASRCKLFTWKRATSQLQICRLDSNITIKTVKSCWRIADKVSKSREHTRLEINCVFKVQCVKFGVIYDFFLSVKTYSPYIHEWRVILQLQQK